MATQDKLGDERLKRDAGTAVVGSRSEADDIRVNADGTALSTEARRRMLRQEWVQEILPSVTAPPGWHYCWLSTTNSTDPIHKRMQMGYLPVKVSEIPGFAQSQYKVVGGDFDGCVACNEMLLFKVEQQRYDDLMAIYHDELPLEQEGAIRERMMGAQERDSLGRGLITTEGFDRLGHHNRY